MDLMELLKVNRPGPGLENLARIGVPAMDDANSSGNDFRTFLNRLMLLAGLNHIVQVNDCETSGDWTESDNGTFDMAVGTTGKRVGTNCLKLTATAACDNSQYVETDYINESAKVPLSLNGKRQMDWRDTQYLGFWIHAEDSAEFGTAGEMTVAIVNNGTVQDKVNVTGIGGTEHRYFQVDMVAEGWSRDKVEKIQFYCNNENAAEDLYVDDIIRYSLQFNGGPMYGGAFPIKSSTTLSENHWVQWTIDGLIAAVTAANVADLGPAWLGSSTLTGNATRSNWALLPGRFIFLIQANAATVAGEGLEWAANGLAAGVSTGVEEKGWAKGLEAAGAQYDHIFACFDTGGRFIS